MQQQSSLDYRSGAAPTFARHETFHPRYGWLTKGFTVAYRYPYVFWQPDAPVILGVGKNMVRAIHYWLQAFKIWAEDEPTAFGRNLLEKWDPYLEDTASLWLLHWQLLRPPCLATAWWVAFNQFRSVEFTAEKLLRVLEDYCTQVGKRVATGSLRKDVSCLLRMYTAASEQTKAGVTEDSLDCPFVQLGLIQAEGHEYRFGTGLKLNLPPEVVVAACLMFVADSLEAEVEGGGTVSLSRLLYEVNSPGLVFKLSESALSEAIERVAQSQGQIRLSDSAGLVQMSFAGSPRQLAEELLNRYYGV
ncbi:MAG: DUF4007 family protein [Thermostichales cyanobacterium BF3_bins_165]